MRMNLQITGMAEVKAELARLSGAEKDRAISAAMNRLAQKGRAEIVRAVTSQYALRADEVRESISLHQASAARHTLAAAISIFGSTRRRGRSLNMVHFLSVLASGIKTRGTRAKKGEIKALAQQLGFTIRRGGGLKQIPGAFVLNKGRTVFMRTGADKTPVKPVQVIGVAQMFNSRLIRTRVLEKIQDDMGIEVRRAVEMVIARRSA